MDGKGDHGSAELTKDGGDGRAGHAQLGKAQQAEDQDGVEDDIDQRAHQLADHGQMGLARGLKHPLIKMEIKQNAPAPMQMRT